MPNNRNFIVGLAMLFIVVLSWVSSSLLLNQIFESNYYRKPIFITYCSVSSCSLYLLPLMKKTLSLYHKTGEFNFVTTYNLEYVNKINTKDDHDDDESTSLLNDLEKDTNDVNTTNMDTKLSLYQIIKLSAIFCTLWFSANLTTNASLSFTSVTSQTILSSTASFFTLFFGTLIGIDSINIKKFIGLFISFFGIIIIVINSNSTSESVILSNKSIIVGNILALLGAAIYGLYSTFFKSSITKNHHTGDVTEDTDSKIDIKLFLGFIGLFTLICLWPILILVDFMNWEKFELVNDKRIILIILINCSITFISDYCWAQAVILTSPLTVTVGLSFTIPFAMLSDFIFKGKAVTNSYLFGASMIIFSFILINDKNNNNNKSPEETQIQTYEAIADYSSSNINKTSYNSI